MLLWRGALAAGLGCGIVFLSVAYAPAAVAFAAPPLTAAVLLGAIAAAGNASPSFLSRRRSARSSTLGDRALLETRAARAISHSRQLTLLTVRLDALEDVNDTLGTTARDRVVAEAGARIAAKLSEGETVARLGGNEIAVLLPSSGPDHARAVGDGMLRRLREPITVDDTSVVAVASIGIVTTAAKPGIVLDDLLRAAHLAMHQAVSEGGNRACVYHAQLLHEARQRLSIETELRAAVAGGELCVFYQPIVDTSTSRVQSVEALVRWEHPTLGLLTPPQFLDAAERIGLMVDIGRHVLELACAQVAVWRRRWPHLAVAVNVSQAELMHPHFAGNVLATLRRHSLPTSALHLEVTETVAVSEETITSALHPLATAGVACSLDDFGTGHSSLHRLRRLPVQRLKIDKSFVAEVGSEESNAPLLASIVSLAHSVGHCVVAEGVETSDQAAFLAAHGCDELQGYLFSRPVPAERVSALLAETSRSVVPTTTSSTSGTSALSAEAVAPGPRRCP